VSPAAQAVSLGDVLAPRHEQVGFDDVGPQHDVEGGGQHLQVGTGQACPIRHAPRTIHPQVGHLVAVAKLPSIAAPIERRLAGRPR